MDDVRSDDPREELLHLNFVPSWARRPPTEYGRRNEATTGEDTAPVSDTLQQRDSGTIAEDRDRHRPEQRRWGASRGARPARRGGPQGSQIRRPSVQTEDRPRELRRRPPPSLPLSIAFLPERHRLGAVVHRIHVSRRAYPLLQLAELFLSRPEFHMVRLEVMEPPSGAPEGQTPASSRSPFTLHQCLECQTVFADHEAARVHVADRHTELWFETRSADEPPSGQFTCVARCPITGRLVGPPNHHSFAHAVAEAHAAAASKLSLTDYRAHLEMIRDSAVIEQWRQQYALRPVYVRRDCPQDPPRSWIEARQLLLFELASSRLVSTRRVIIPGTVAEQISDRAVRVALQTAWKREQAFPRTMMNALRPALRHMKLHFFKVARHHTYVSAIQPAPMTTPEHAIAPIRDALTYLATHPGTRRDEMANDVLRERSNDEAARDELFSHLAWLIEKGHVIEYFDGSLAVPAAPASGPETTSAPSPNDEAPD